MLFVGLPGGFLAIPKSGRLCSFEGMKIPLLGALVSLALAGCNPGGSAPVPTPKPLVADPTGSWVSDNITAEPVGNRNPANVKVIANSGSVDLSGGRLLVNPAVMVNSSASSASVEYTLALPLLRHPAQDASVGRIDSFINVTNTSFTWRHYTGSRTYDPKLANLILTGHFHR